MASADYKAILLSQSRAELNITAKKLRIKNYSHGTKEDLIDSIVASRTPKQIKRIIAPSLWNRFHNHIYGIASIVGVILAVSALIPSHQKTQKEPAAILSTNSSDSASRHVTPPNLNPTTTPSSEAASLTAPQLRQPVQKTGSVHIAKSLGGFQTSTADKTTSKSNSVVQTNNAASPAVISFVLSSRVFDEDGDPISGVRVTLVDNPKYSTQTASNGYFILEGVPKKLNDRAKLRVECNGYTTEEITAVIGRTLQMIYLKKTK